MPRTELLPEVLKDISKADIPSLLYLLEKTYEINEELLIEAIIMELNKRKSGYGFSYDLWRNTEEGKKAIKELFASEAD